MNPLKSLPIKYLVLTLFICVIALTATYGWVNNRIEKAVEEDFYTTVNTQLRVVDKSLGQTLTGINQDLSLFASLPTIKNISSEITSYKDQSQGQIMRPSKGKAEEQNLYQLLSIYAMSHPGIIYAYVATENGGYLCWPETEISAHYDPRTRPWYKEALDAEGEVIQTKPYKDVSSDKILVSQVKEIRNDQGETVGVIGFDYTMEKLANAINETDVVYGGFYILIHSNEMILADPSHSTNQFKTLSEAYPEVKNLYQKSAVFQTKLDSGSYLGFGKAITGTKWKLIILSPKSQVYQGSKDLAESLMVGSMIGIMGLLIVVLGILYMFFYNRSLHKMVTGRTEDLQEMIDTLVSKEQSLILSESQYSGLVDNLPGIVYRCDPNPPWKMQTVSKWVEIMTGYSPEDFLGDPPKMYWDSIIHPEDKDNVDKATSDENNYDFTTEYRIVAKDGTVRWVFEKGSLIDTGYGQKYMDGVIFDNTEKKLASEELKKLYEELEDRVEERTKALKDAMSQLVEQEKMASLGGIVSGVAHEINTPLGISVTVASYLKKINEELKLSLAGNTLSKNKMNEFLNGNTESLGILETNLARAAELVNSFKKISVNQSTEDMTLFNLKDYLGMILLSLKHEYKNKDYHIEIECDSNILIYSYAGVYSQIFTNFLMNSFIHGFKDKASGEIKIKATQYIEEKRLVVIYTDNGHGIPEETLDRIFEPFFTTNRANGGSGLGLYIVYNLVSQKLGGSINCHSTHEGGTTFVIDVPLVGEPPR